MKSKSLVRLAVPMLFAMMGPMSAHAAVDAEDAQALMKKEKCTKCHAADKDRSGPSLKKIAAKYKGKADGEEKIIKNLTTSPKVKLDDGSEEEHKMVKTKDDAQLKNLAQWILGH